MGTAPTPAPTPSPIGLTTVAAEIAYLADYATDLLRAPVVSAADKARISGLLKAAEADLTTAIAQISARLDLGSNPIIDDQAPPS
jgi:hypothetical protein